MSEQPLVDRQSDGRSVGGVNVDVGPYRGHRQFQEGLGLFFGTFNEIVNVPRSDADFNLSMVVIR